MDRAATMCGVIHIVNGWRCVRQRGHAELASAIHVLQGFTTQHMLARVAPEHWGDWWEARHE